MPINIVEQILGCFGLDCLQDRQQREDFQVPPARPRTSEPAPTAYAAPASRPTYKPGQNYSIAELNQFATSNLPSAANRLRFQSQLRDTLVMTETSRPNKAMLCKHLATLMTDEDHLECNGAIRQANYFASYCVDLSIQELNQQYSAVMEQNLRDILTLWFNTLCPGQSEFNLNGIIYSRSEVQDMLKAPSLISRQLQQTNSDVARQLERRLRGQGSTSNYQTVHDRAVQNNAGRVLDIMRAKHGQTDELSHDAVREFVTNASKTHPSRTNVLAAMDHCLSNTNRDNNWNVDIHPQHAIKDVIQYIQSVPDETMHLNLTNALLERLREIHVEGPCVSGVLQRLIDVPNGIDPDMNFTGASRQIAEDMATLASKTYSKFSDLIEEGVRAVEHEEHNSDVTRTIAGTIGRDMFHTRVDQDMKLMGGLNETELAPHRERLKEGFDTSFS